MVKSLDEFSNNRNKKDGKHNRCKACDKKHYEANKTILTQQSNAWHHLRKEEFNAGIRDEKVHTFVVNRLLAQARSRAKEYQVPFNLTKEDIIISDTCPVLGIRFQMGDGVNGPHSPSLDRTVPERGYVKGNVHVISLLANQIKSSATLDDIQKVVAWMKTL
jgi:hypothetical protein